MTPDEHVFIGLMVVIAAVGLFFLPSIIAFSKGHKQAWIILFINVVFGFTLIGWFGSLIWAIAGDDII